MNVLPKILSIDDLGGVLVDSGVGVVNATTDLSAAAGTAARAVSAASSRTVARAFVHFVTNATTPTLAAANPWDAVWKRNTPTAPIPTRNAQGDWEITWPTSVTDELMNNQALSLRWAKPLDVSGATFVHVQCFVETANTIRVYTMDAAGAKQDFVGTTIGVEVG